MVQELGTTIQITIHDEGVDLALGETFQGLPGLVFNCDIDVKTTKDAFQNTHFRPVARDNHRGKSHIATLAAGVTAP
jgi:hypothetical protein